jgi:succinate dehydrogenase/fumarate reductase flavoprotein subunit
LKTEKAERLPNKDREAKYGFEIPPDPVPESEIADIVKTEVVIVGSGTSGLVCATSAAENGTSVIVISASSRPIGRGGSNHAVNSKLTRELGINYDIGKALKQEIDRAGGRIDQGKWSLFIRKSGEVMDWLIDKMVAAGYKPVLERGVIDPDGLISGFPGSHSFLGGNIEKAGRGQLLVVNTLARHARAAGVRIYYKTIAKQLVRENNNTGRVTAVIAVNPHGEYIKYVGSKAVVLATGDFTRDQEMVRRYCPEMLPLVNKDPVNYDDIRVRSGGVYAGDGHKMGLWVGAAWQRAVPCAPMLASDYGPSPQPFGSFKGLAVNKYGVRFCNEDISATHAGYIQMRQPDWKIFAIWDSEYAQRMAPWYARGSHYSEPELSVESVVAEWEAGVKAGTILKADTIETLARELGLDVETFKATVDRYNTSCQKGVDEDFFKRAGFLIPIRTGPFYGKPSNAPRLVIICGGLRTNLKMQVLDTEGKIIPGLYAVGTIVGDMFANYYSYMPAGIHLGANCLTFGYLTGKEIALS